MKYNSDKRRRWQHLCLYGEPKTGKSELAGELAKHGYKIIWVALDSGFDFIGKFPKEAQENFELIVLPDTKDNPIGIATCLKLMDGKKQRVCDEHGRVNCLSCDQKKLEFTSVDFNNMPEDHIVVFDHGSQIADSALHYIIMGQTSKLTQEARDLYKPEWDDFRVQGTLLTRFLSNVQQARFNVIVLAHVVEIEQEDGKKKLVPQMGTTNYSRNASKYFDHIVYLSVGNRSHRVGSSTTYDTNAVSGSRLDIALEDSKLEKGERPSLLPFFAHIIPGKPEDQDAVRLQSVQEAADTSTAVKTLEGLNVELVKTELVKAKVDTAALLASLKLK